MSTKFRKDQIIYLVLLPLFFVLHSWNEFHYLIHLSDTIWIALILISISLLLFLLSKVAWRNKLKAGLFSFVLMLFFLFYGYIHDQVQFYLKAFAHHRILLSCIISILIISTIFLIKQKQESLKRLAYFLNICLTILCSYEIILLSKIIIDDLNPVKITKENSSNFNQQKQPDIYILVFDEYASSKSLKRDYGYNNSELDSFIVKNNFFLMKESKSNYLRTNLSIASLLNYEYTSGLTPRESMNAEDISASHKNIKYNKLFNLCKSYGYEIYNYSIFDTEKSPSKIKNEYLFHNERIIITNTMISRLINDLGPNFKSPLLKKILDTEITPEVYRRYNQKAVGVLLSDLKRGNRSSPKLVYAHFLMPHPPFLYSKSLEAAKSRNIKMDNYYDKKYIPQYLDYLPYTNSQLKKVVNEILLSGKDNSIIFLLGDHGYKIMNDTTLPTDHYFNNLQAVYLPKKNYAPLKETSTPINVMRHIINTAFNKNLPFLRDSAVLVGNKW
jgi:hypothetical protein